MTSLFQSFGHKCVVSEIRQCYFQQRCALHLALYCVDSTLVARPRTACDTVVDIPQEHIADSTRSIFRAVDYHAEASVYNLAPAYAATVVNRNPCGTTERVAYHVVHSHVGSEARAVIYIRRLAIR